MRKVLLVITLLFAFPLFANNLSYQELQSIAKESADQFLKEYKNKEKMTLIVSNFINQTSIDQDIFIRTLIREIRKSGQYDVINRVENDAMIKDARAMRQDEEYDPYTTIEKGSLIAPDISLSGKITKTINNQEETYLFLLTLTDIKTGIVIWDRDVILSKDLKTSNTKITSGTPLQTQVSKPKKEENKIQDSLNQQSKNSFFFFGLDGEVGSDKESNVLYSGDLKIGYTYKWNESYAISFYGMYRFWNDFDFVNNLTQSTQSTTRSNNAKFPNNYPNKDDEENDENDESDVGNGSTPSKIVHGLGGGIQLKMGYFYLGGGVVVELENTELNYLGEAGLNFPLGSVANLNIGARYTYSQSKWIKHRFGGVLGFSFNL